MLIFLIYAFIFHKRDYVTAYTNEEFFRTHVIETGSVCHRKLDINTRPLNAEVDVSILHASF